MMQLNKPLDIFSLLRPLEKPRVWIYVAYVTIVNEYRRTLLGPVWILLSLIIFAFAIGSVYSGLFDIGYFEYVEYMTTGMIGWIWASNILVASGMVYLNNSSLIMDHPTDKAYLIWAHAVSQVIVFLHQLPFIMLFMIFGDIPVGINTLFIIPSILIVFTINIGVAAILSILVTRYRDLQKIISSLVIIIMITTPIFWKPDMIEGVRKLLYLLNPFYYIVEIIRDPLLGKDPNWHNYGVALSIAIVALVLGSYVHKHHSPSVVFRL